MDNYQLIGREIAEAAIASGRTPEDVQLIAVTKTVTWPLAKGLYEQGQRNFAENRLVDALEKELEAPVDCKWHLIGTLQSNKVRKAIGHFVLIHSVDTLALASKISHYSQELGIITKILLQVNTSGELSKHGMSPVDCLRDYTSILKLPSIGIEGLMTMAPLTENESVIRQCFAGLRRLRDELNAAHPGIKPMVHLSMGMSHDFKLAIAEGATMVRIGTALFS